MSIIKGDIKRALGFGEIVLGEGENKLTIDLSLTTAKDIVEFQELPIRAAKGKKFEDLTADDMLTASKDSTDWLVKYFTEKDPECDKGEIELLVAKHKPAIQKEFTIGFGIKTREEFDHDEAKARETLSKKD